MQINLLAGRLAFRPRLVPTVATLVLLPFLTALGFWQLDRAHQKEQLASALASRFTQPAVTNANLDKDLELRYRKAEVSGTYLVDRQMLLDNQVRGGRAGYLVYTPLRLPGQQQVLLVNRGWIPAGSSREVLPQLTAPAGEVRLQGLLDLPPRPGLRLGDTVVVSEGWPLVVLELDPKMLAGRLGAGVLPLSLRVTDDVDARLVQDEINVKRFKPERHLGYAAQWFGLAIALVVIFVVVNTRVAGGRHENRG